VRSDKWRVRSYGLDTKLQAVKVEASAVTAGREETQAEISEGARKRQVSNLEQSRNGAEPVPAMRSNLQPAPRTQSVCVQSDLQTVTER